MSLAQFNPNMPTIYVSGDWTNATVIAADITNQWGIDFGTAYTFTIDMWEGPLDSNDFGSLSVALGVPAIATAFASTPPIGSIVYVLDIFFT